MYRLYMSSIDSLSTVTYETYAECLAHLERVRGGPEDYLHYDIQWIPDAAPDDDDDEDTIAKLRQRAEAAEAENVRLLELVALLRNDLNYIRLYIDPDTEARWLCERALAATEPAPCTEHEWKADASPDPNNPRWFLVDGGGMAKARNVECARCGIDGLDALAATEPKEEV